MLLCVSVGGVNVWSYMILQEGERKEAADMEGFFIERIALSYK